MEQWKKDLVSDYQDLKAKLDRLIAFKNNPTYLGESTIERIMVNQQLEAMTEYLKVLALRIAHYNLYEIL